MTYIGLDASKYERTAGGGKNIPLPPAIYHGIITRTTLRDNSAKAKDPNGKKLEVEFDITYPSEFGNRKFWDTFNIINKETGTVRIAREQLSDLVKAAGLTTLGEASELEGKEVALVLYVKESDNPQYPDPKNECGKYWPVGTTTEQHEAWRKTKAKPNVQSVPSPQQSTIQTSGKAPWARK